MAYAGHKGLRRDVANVFWLVIRRMDQAERSWQVENLKGASGG